MSARRLGIGTLVGGAAVLATGVERQSPLLWAVALGALHTAHSYPSRWGRGGSVSVGGGVAIGALVGLPLWFTANLMFYAISNVGNLTSTIVDSVLEPVPGAIAGGVIAALLGKIR